MVFDATPAQAGSTSFLRVGFAQRNQEEAQIVPTDDPVEEILHKFLPVIYAVIAALALAVLCTVWFTCYRMRQRAKYAGMSRDEQGDNAEQILAKYNSRMDEYNAKKADDARAKAIKRWKKAHPGQELNVENFEKA